MGLKYLKSKKGFTLVEILIVIIIIGVLVAIAVPKFIQIASVAEHSVWKYNSTYIVKIFALNIYKYEGEDRYSAPSAGDFDYAAEGLNNFLEKELENFQADSNKDNIKNPRSGSKKVLHANNPISGSVADGNDPAVFITGNSAFSHTGSGSTGNLIGSIVAYINQAEPYNVQVYYIDDKGLKSAKIADFD